MAVKKTPFGGKQAPPFGKGGKQGAKEDTRAKKATAPKKAAKKR